jgi:hypothetical protein
MAKEIPITQYQKIGQFFMSVFGGEMTMSEARFGLRTYVNSLSAEDQKKFRDEAVPRARILQTVSEAFVQELTVIGAGQ